MVRVYEFDPRAHAKDGRLRLDLAEVEQALVPYRSSDAAASGSAGWDAAAPIPWEHMGERT